MKNPNSLLILLIIWPVLFHAQVQGNFQQQGGAQENEKAVLPVDLSDNSVVLQAEVLYNAQPSNYLAIFAIAQDGESIAETDTFMNQRIAAFKRGLRSAGVSDSDIFVDFISLAPQYEVVLDKKKRSKTANEVPNGFQLKKNVHIRFTDSRLLDKIVGAAAAAEIYDLAKVETNVADIQKIHAALKEEAGRIIIQKVKLWNDFNLKTTPVSVGENFETWYPTELYEEYAAWNSDASQLSAFQQKKLGKMGIKYANKDRTVFYNRLPYDQFDVVINPEFTEPPIQIHYKMAVKYLVENNELAAKRELENARQREREDQIRKEELEVRKIQAANPPKNR